QRRVRLLRRLREHAQAHPAPLRAAEQVGGLRARARSLATLAHELLNGRHESLAPGWWGKYPKTRIPHVHPSDCGGTGSGSASRNPLRIPEANRGRAVLSQKLAHPSGPATAVNAARSVSPSADRSSDEPPALPHRAS